MKKVFGLILAAGMFAAVACGGNSHEEAPAADSTATMEATTDSSAMPVDSAAAAPAADSAAHAAPAAH